MAIDNRTNLWTFLIYPGDSAPDNYIEIIRSWHIPAAVSPVHEAEAPDDPLSKESGQFKKHVHVVIYFGTGQKKSESQIQELSSSLGGTKIFPVQSRNGIIRYLIHYDEPDTKQHKDLHDGHEWTEDDIILLSGFDVADAFGSFIKDQEYYDFIEEKIFEHKIVNAADLILFFNEYSLLSEKRFFRTHTYYFDRVMDGMYRRLKKKKAAEKSVENN